MANYPGAKFVQVEHERISELADYVLHVHDLEDVVAATVALGDSLRDGQPLPNTGNTLWTGAVLTYARCFDGARFHRLNAHEVYSSEAQEMHQEFWNLRSKHYAHDVNDHRQVSVGAALSNEGTVLDVVWLASAVAHWRRRVPELLWLADTALSFARHRQQKLAEQIAASVEQYSPADRLSLPTMVKPAVAKLNIQASRRNQT